MSLSDDISADFLDMWEEFQCKVSIGEAHDIPALITAGNSELELDLGGFEHRNDLEVRVLRASLKNFPKIGALLTFEGSVYRIASINGKQSFPILTLQCQEK